MSDVAFYGACVTAAAMLLVAVITGFWAWKNKRTPEPTPIEKTWTRMDKLQDDIDELQTWKTTAIEKIDDLTVQVKAFRGGFLAYGSAWARSKASGRVEELTEAESAAIFRAQTVQDGHELSY